MAHDAAEPSPVPLRYAMLSHPGRVRHSNQDAAAAAHEFSAFVVCDGVGGAAGGEIASRLAADSFLDALRRSVSGRGQISSAESAPARLRNAVRAANRAVLERAQRSRGLRGMATTLVAALLEYPADGPPARPSHNASPKPADQAPFATCPTLWLVHAGDSRAYRFRNGALELLTCDHSLVEEQVRAGIISRADALRSPVRNVITRAIGAVSAVDAEIASHAIEPGDLYLLASDGLTRELTDPAIARILAATPPQRNTGSLETIAQALVQAANENGGRDNITVLLIACR